MKTLCSNSVLKPNTELEINKFGMVELGKLSASCELKDSLLFMEAIAETVTSHSLTELSIGDLLQIATYHRINAFPNTPIELRWKCSGLLFKVEGEESDEMELLTLDQVRERKIENAIPMECNSQNVKTFTVDDFPFISMKDITDLDPRLEVPNASLYPEMIELAKIPHTSKLVFAAVWVKGGRTIEDKLELLGNEETLDLFDVASKASKEYQHGPSGTISAKCPKCNSLAKQRVHVDQTSFFR